MMERGRRFLARIDAERSVIAAVNSFPRCATFQLAGLARGAIDDWTRRASDELPRSTVDDVRAILLEAALQTGAISDNSKGVFEAHSIGEADIESFRERLQTAFSSPNELT